MNLHVIVRAAGERTAEYVCSEWARQSASAAVERVELTPFWRTLREGLDRGLKSGAPWVLSVDADILPAPDAVLRVQQWIAGAEPRTAVLSGMFQDKLLGGIRFGGVRVYRAAVIPEVLDAMPALGENVRPESSAITRLAGRGWQHKKITDLVGLHDYEQYYRDIYRKAFLHLQKHGYAAGRLIAFWKKMAPEDADYRVALGGGADALMALTEVDCDASSAVFQPTALLERLGIKEKLPLQFGADRYQVEIQRAQERLDSGEVEPVEPLDQNEFESARPESDLVQRIERIGDHLKLLAGHSPATRAAALHQVRRALPDGAILNTFGLGELVRYGLRRAGRFGKR